MQNSKVVEFRHRGNKQVGQSHPVLSEMGELMLHFNRSVGHLLSERIGGQRTALGEDALVVRQGAGAVEDFEIDDRTGGNQAFDEQRP